MYSVYIVRCSDGTFYTGIAKDVEKRLYEHNHGAKAARYTRARRPVTLVYREACSDKSSALVREHAIKRLNRPQKSALIEKYAIVLAHSNKGAAMSQAEELIELLEEDVIPEIESFIDEIYEAIAASKNASEDDKAQLAELQELKKEFELLLEEVKNGELDEEECGEIIDEIDMMRSEEDGEA